MTQTAVLQHLAFMLCPTNKMFIHLHFHHRIGRNWTQFESVGVEEGGGVPASSQLSRSN